MKPIMECKFKAVNPDDIVMEMTIEMPLQDWKHLRDDIPLNLHSISFDFRLKIIELIKSAETHFYSEEKEE